MSDEPSVVELLEQLAQRDVLIGQLQEQLVQVQVALAAALERIAELERRLGQNPRNSDQPPSSEGLARPAPKSLRRRSGRRPGGQPGHPGTTLRQVEAPDVVVRHEPAACQACGSDLAGGAEVGLTRRQVFEIPPMKATVTEHQLVTRRCGCGACTTGAAPEQVAAPVQYGPRLTAIVIYLLVAQFGAKQRVAQAVGDLFGVLISQGSVAALVGRAARRLEGDFLGFVRQALRRSELVHLDETGLRVDGRLHWVHSASTGKYTLVWVHPKRGRQAIDEGGVLPGFTGIAVHDAWAPYDCYTEATHGLCNAHLLRELIAATEADTDAQVWAQQGIDALLALKAAGEAAIKAGTGSIDAKLLAEQVDRFRQTALIGIKDHSGQKTKLGKKLHALARRMRDRLDDYLRFARDPLRCPFDNYAEVGVMPMLA